jgi:hypothetical protein
MTPSISEAPAIAARSVRALASTWRGRFILAWLAVQLALPLVYYTMRHDRHDERFAWRMFSPMRMIKCNPQFVAGGKPVDLASRFHEDWIRIAQRGRYAVIEAMGARLCADTPRTPIELHMTCDNLDGSVETFPVYDVCIVKHL